MEKVSFIAELNSVGEGYKALNSLGEADVFEATHTSDGRFYIFGEASQSEIPEGFYKFSDPERKIANALLGLKSEDVKDSIAVLESESLAELVDYLLASSFEIYEILSAKSTGGKSIAFVHGSSYPEQDKINVTQLKNLNSRIRDFFI